MRRGGAGRYSGGGFPAAPAQVKANGLAGTLVFADDFTSNQIATTQGASSGSKWYWGEQSGSPTQCWAVNTTTLARNIANGDNGTGGSFASPSGGILTLTGPGGINDALISVPGWTLNTGSDTLPTAGCWGVGTYWEIYAQVNVANVVPPLGNGWPAFWLMGAEGLKNYAFGSSSLNATITEVDVVEIFNTQFSDAPGTNGWAVHQPSGLTTVASNVYSTANSEWHKYGFLWIPGWGKVFKDDVQVGSTFSTSGLSMAGGQHQFMILGTSNLTGAQFNVDYVNVWN